MKSKETTLRSIESMNRAELEAEEDRLDDKIADASEVIDAARSRGSGLTQATVVTPVTVGTTCLIAVFGFIMDAGKSGQLDTPSKLDTATRMAFALAGGLALTIVLPVCLMTILGSSYRIVRKQVNVRESLREERYKVRSRLRALDAQPPATGQGRGKRRGVARFFLT